MKRVFFWFVFILNLHLLSILLCLTQEGICKGWKLFFFYFGKKRWYESSEFVIASDPFPKRLFWGCCIVAQIDSFNFLVFTEVIFVLFLPSLSNNWQHQSPADLQKSLGFWLQWVIKFSKHKMFLNCRRADRSLFTQKWTALNPMGCCVWPGLHRLAGGCCYAKYLNKQGNAY